jgi:hypothetical protein
MGEASPYRPEVIQDPEEVSEEIIEDVVDDQEYASEIEIPDELFELGENFEDWGRFHKVYERSRKEGERVQRLAGGVIQAMAKSPWLKPISTLVGAGILGGAIATHEPKGVQEALGQQIEQAAELSPEEVGEVLENPEVQEEVQALILDQLIAEGSMVITDQKDNIHREGWSHGHYRQYLDSMNAGDLMTAFYLLHEKHEIDIARAFKSDRGKIENYGVLVQVMNNEFRYTKLQDIYTIECIMTATELLPTLEYEDAVKMHKQFTEDLLHYAGLFYVHDMTSTLLRKTDPSDPFHLYLDSTGFGSKETAALVTKKNLKNRAYFNQDTGRLEVSREMTRNGRTKIVLIDSAPANGGKLHESDRKGESHQYKETESGRFTLGGVNDRFKTPRWRDSWIGDGSPLRAVEENGEIVAVEYQDKDGSWYLATGEDAEYFGHKIFKAKWRSDYYNAATRRVAKEKLSEKFLQELEEKGINIDQKIIQIPPFPSTVDDFKQGGVLMDAYENNAFGPTSIYLRDAKGEVTGQMIHSSPSDEAPGVALQESHGCIHMKPADIEMVAGLLAVGSTIEVSPKDFMPTQGELIVWNQAE